MEKIKSVSIIIPTKNGQRTIASVLEAVFRNQDGFDIEVVIVDSGSRDRTKEIAARFPVKLIEIPPESFTHGRARNIGADNAAGKILVFLTQDAVPKDEYWLLNLTSGFSDPDAAGVFGRQIPNEDAFPLETTFLRHVYPDRMIIKNSVDPGNCALPDILFSNVNSAIRRSEWVENRFREDLIMSEDQAWSKDMLMKNKKIIYEPAAVVYHSHNYTVSRLVGRNFDSGLSLKTIINASFRRNFLYESDYIRSAICCLFSKGLYRYLIIFPFYEFLRIAAFIIGRYSHPLPLWFKRMLSENKVYWQKR